LIEEASKPVHSLGMACLLFISVEKLAFLLKSWHLLRHTASLLFCLRRWLSLEIRNNISAALKSELDKRGLNATEFAKVLGIPRTTLRGYLKGTSSPRTDTLEELAKKLGISPAELVAGNEYPRSTGISCLDSFLLELPSLHPRVLPAAQNAVSLLQYVFRISSNFDALDEMTVPEELPDAMYRYFFHELKSPSYHSPA